MSATPKPSRKRVLKTVLLVLLCLFAAGLTALFSINAAVKHAAAGCILTPEAAAQLTDADCILVLGCGVRADGSPSDMLADRLTRAVSLYELGAAPKLLMSGDHGRADYNEVGTMKTFATDAGVPSEDVFMDHAGFSTYETMARARDVFGVKKAVIVTQEYHLYRALFLARRLGIEAYGVSADYRAYYGQTYRDCRELLARCKDFAMGILQPPPTYLGEAIPISGSGDATNDG